MSDHAPVTALRVANEAFLVSSTIDRCPKTMMIRELVVNAIEAASQSITDKRVDIMSVQIDGTTKLCIRNAGRGMSAIELDRICDLASSLYKQNSLDGNFGMGAKVASLPSNKHGLRYRSCKDGTVSQVILCQRDGIYGRLRVPDASGQLAELIDATETCRTEGGYDLTSDWTEVVLFGNAASQNTVTDPYAANPK
ncbi:MAG TPA: ATP-binding protein, partial [Rhodopila sp.]